MTLDVVAAADADDFKARLLKDFYDP